MTLAMMLSLLPLVRAVRRTASAFLLLAQVVVQPAQNSLPVRRITERCGASPDEAFLADSDECASTSRLETVCEDGLAFAEEWVGAEPSRQNDLPRRVDVADFAPLVEQCSVAQLDGDAPSPLRSEIGFPILEPINAAHQPPLLDYVCQQPSERLIPRPIVFGA